MNLIGLDWIELNLIGLDWIGLFAICYLDSCVHANCVFCGDAQRVIEAFSAIKFKIDGNVILLELAPTTGKVDCSFVFAPV